MDSQQKISTFEYLKGENFTQALKDSLGLSTFSELSDLTGVTRQTISTWNTCNRNSHELVVRIHLRTGIPVHELILPKDYPTAELHYSFSEGAKTSGGKGHAPSPEQQNAQLATFAIPSFCLNNGQLLPTGGVPYAQRIFTSWDLDPNSTIEVETDEGRFLVDKKLNDAVSGDYLIDIAGRMSINHVQRLPNKLAIVFGKATVEVSEEDINVIGRVAIVLLKK